MPISSNSSPEEDAFFYTDTFKTIVRANKEIFVSTASFFPLSKPYEVNAYRYDFYRLLRVNKVAARLWWATSYINDIKDPTNDVQGMTSFLLINEQVLQDSLVRSNTRIG